jgi:hypothetical protein
MKKRAMVVSDKLALLYLASMKGSAKRSRTLCKFTMKLSVATDSGSTYGPSFFQSMNHKRWSILTCIAARFTLSEIAVAKYRSTASRESGDARIRVLKIWNSEDYNTLVNFPGKM